MYRNFERIYQTAAQKGTHNEKFTGRPSFLGQYSIPGYFIAKQYLNFNYWDKHYKWGKK